MFIGGDYEGHPSHIGCQNVSLRGTYNRVQRFDDVMWIYCSDKHKTL